MGSLRLVQYSSHILMRKLQMQPILRKKKQGFRNYFDQHDLNRQYRIVKANLIRHDHASFVKQLDELFDKTPDLKGIFVSTSKAYEIADYLQNRHIHHLKIVGYDLVPSKS